MAAEAGLPACLFWLLGKWIWKEEKMDPKKSLAACLWIMALLAMVSSNSNPDGILARQEEVEQHCTVFYAADDQVALGGNNEDNYGAGPTHIWFIPPEEERYGMALVGYGNFLNPEGAVNDQGLFFDGLAVRNVEIPLREGTQPYNGSAIMKIMTECATVDCALAFFEKYSMAGTWNGQYLLGDAQGDSAIIEPAAIIRKEGSFQVATNFFQSEVAPAYRTDTRYVEATRMLRNAEHFSVDLFRNTLDVVHQQYDGDAQNAPLHTQYSTIYDLRQGLIYLYYFHDFEHVVTFDLKKELGKGIHAYEISSLFPPSPVAMKLGAETLEGLADLRAGLQPAKVDPDLLREYEGRYQIEALQSYLDGIVYVKSENGRLFIRNPWMPWVEGVPQANGDFIYQYLDPAGSPHQITFSFVKNASGPVTKMELAMDGGQKAPASKLSIGSTGDAAKENGSGPTTTPSSGFRGMAAPLVFLALLLGLGLFGIFKEIRREA